MYRSGTSGALGSGGLSTAHTYQVSLAAASLKKPSTLKKPTELNTFWTGTQSGPAWPPALSGSSLPSPMSSTKRDCQLS